MIDVVLPTLSFVVQVVTCFAASAADFVASATDDATTTTSPRNGLPVMLPLDDAWLNPTSSEVAALGPQAENADGSAMALPGSASSASQSDGRSASVRRLALVASNSGGAVGFGATVGIVVGDTAGVDVAAEGDDATAGLAVVLLPGVGDDVGLELELQAIATHTPMVSVTTKMPIRILVPLYD